jgi:hypothetical protein
MIQLSSAAVALGARIGCTLPEWLQASPRGPWQEEDGAIRVPVETMATSS